MADRLLEFISEKCVHIINAVDTHHITHVRNNAWENDNALWTDALMKSPQKARVIDYAGTSYLERDDFDEAFRHFNTVIEKDPGPVVDN